MCCREEKHQFFEVNFTSKVKIRRLSMKGQGKNFVRTFHLYYSNNGAIWTPYKEGSKLKVRQSSPGIIAKNKGI